MSEVHTITCDRCRRSAPMVQAVSFYSWLKPDGWVRDPGDLCPRCAKELVKMKKEFINDFMEKHDSQG